MKAIDAPKTTRNLARNLRATLSPPEARLWVALRRRSVQALKFRRQHPLGPYVLDFYCESARLAVEVDGECHGFGDQPQRDERRDAWVARQGITTLRVRAADVRNNLDGVITSIQMAAGSPPSPASPVLPPEGGERTRKDTEMELKGVDWNQIPWERVREGVERKAFSGEGATVSLNRLRPGHEPRPHAHPNEQIVYILQGQIDFHVGEEVRRLGPGGLLVLPPNVTHWGVVVGDETVLNLDVFTPKRSEYAA